MKMYLSLSCLANRGRQLSMDATNMQVTRAGTTHLVCWRGDSGGLEWHSRWWWTFATVWHQATDTQDGASHLHWAPRPSAHWLCKDGSDCKHEGKACHQECFGHGRSLYPLHAGIHDQESYCMYNHQSPVQHILLCVTCLVSWLVCQSFYSSKFLSLPCWGIYPGFAFQIKPCQLLET